MGEFNQLPTYNQVMMGRLSREDALAALHGYDPDFTLQGNLKDQGRSYPQERAHYDHQASYSVQSWPYRHEKDKYQERTMHVPDTMPGGYQNYALYTDYSDLGLNFVGRDPRDPENQFIYMDPADENMANESPLLRLAITRGVAPSTGRSLAMPRRCGQPLHNTNVQPDMDDRAHERFQELFEGWTRRAEFYTYPRQEDVSPTLW